MRSISFTSFHKADCRYLIFRYIISTFSFGDYLIFEQSCCRKSRLVLDSRKSGVFPVRRITGVLLLLLLTIPSVTPLFARSAQADLPACCRRSGKHHCAEHMQMPDSNQTQFRSAGMTCPMFPARLATPGHSPQILPTNSQSFYSAVVSHPAIHAQTEISYRICWSRSQQKRGPPVIA
jgi:hypothetical protein